MTSSRACRCSRSRAVVRTAPNPVVLRPQPGTLSHAVDRRNQFRRGRRKLGVAVSALLRVASALTAEQAGSRFEPTTTIQLIIKATVAPGALIHTDEYGILRPPGGLGLSAQNGLPRARTCSMAGAAFKAGLKQAGRRPPPTERGLIAARSMATDKDRLRLSPLLVQAVLADTGARDPTLS